MGKELEVMQYRLHLILAISAFAAIHAASGVAGGPLPQGKHKGTEADVNAIGKRNLGQGTNFYSMEKERQLGKQLAQEVERSSKILDDAAVTDYINRLAHNVAHNSDARLPIMAKVIIADQPNTIALPGGYLFINTGLILQAQGEAGLAAALAHGIAHVALRSATKQATKGQLIQLASIAAMIFLPYGWYGIYEGMNLAIPLTFLKFSRDAQLAADYFGVQYLYKTGYAPEEYVQLLERTGQYFPASSNIPKAFSAYPSIPDRVKPIREEIAQILPPRDDAIVSTSEFDMVLEHLRARLAQKPADRDAAKPHLRRAKQ